MMTRIEDPNHFLDLAFGYYLTGRFAALNHLNIAPNLMHHSVELLAKFTLLKGVPEGRISTATWEVKDKYRHNLTKLWNAYKRTVAHADLARFDAVVRELDRWEKLRYGGFPDATTIAIGVGLHRGQLSVAHVSTQNTYDFGLYEVDELLAVMITASGVSPTFLGSRHRHKTELHDWYIRENQHVVPGIFGRPDDELQ